ncbi:MAG: hypothetical protein AAB405_00035 [Patescibacteria group bacterium]
MKKYPLLLFFSIALFIISALLFINSEVFAVDQIKSVEFYAVDSNTPVNSQINQQFSIYIGDNLSGVTNPIKSVYFIVSGVATSSGAGSLEFKIDSDSATSKVFSFPDVASAPTPFELVYKDNSNKINPSSAGSYSYTLNIIPTNITIYGLGVKAITTYRYAPISCPDGQPANEKIKTNEFFAVDSDIPISSTLNSPFSFYIGDNLSGVTNPIKSVYFIVSGVATSSGAGSLEFKIDSDSATSKVFSFPDVASAPTPFELVYKDNSNKINPSSAGSYSYTLNITPTNITISGLGVKVIETHRYRPPSCGGGTYWATGDIISPIFDTGATNGVGYNWLMATGTTPIGTKIKVQLATSNCSNGATNSPDCTNGSWGQTGSDYIGPAPDCNNSVYYYNSVLPSSPTPQEIKCYNNHNNKRYFRYKTTLESNPPSYDFTPQIDDIIINWSP